MDLDKAQFCMDEIYEVFDPVCGYNGYLLRTKTPAEERGSDAILVLDPLGRKGRLSDNLEDRIDVRKSWFKPTGRKNRWICVNFTGYDFPEFDREEVPENVWLEWGYKLIKYAKKCFPSFETFVAVWHTKQVTEMGERPPHLHIMMRKVAKRLTDNERYKIEGWKT